MSQQADDSKDYLGTNEGLEYNDLSSSSVVVSS